MKKQKLWIFPLYSDGRIGEIVQVDLVNRRFSYNKEDYTLQPHKVWRYKNEMAVILLVDRLSLVDSFISIAGNKE